MAAYAQKDFAKANDIWEQLAGTPLPPDLLAPTWTQIGNVSYRLVQETIASAPDEALSGLEQSREAYRVALSHDKRNQIAVQNLALVEKELEKIQSLLAQRLVEESKKESQVEKAIDKLQAALDHQQSANELAPKDARSRPGRKSRSNKCSPRSSTKRLRKPSNKPTKPIRTIAGRLSKPASNSKPPWPTSSRRETYNSAGSDGKKGRRTARPEKARRTLWPKPAARNSTKPRTKRTTPPSAPLDRFDAALQNFEQALALQPNHQDAQQGENEVKKEMEEIHLDQGDQDQKTAEEQAKHSPDQAAGKMLSALEHFEQARDLDPQSKPIQDRIDRVEQELPAMLMAMSKREQQEAAQAEPKSPESAVAHLERAETALDKTEQLAPQNQEAQGMQKQVQADLARLRQQLADQAEKQQQQQAQKGQEPKDQSKFGDMLADAKATQDQKEMNAHHQPPHKYDPSKSASFRNW